MLTVMCSSDLIAILRGGPYNAVTQLRDIPSCKSSFLKVHLEQEVTFWVPTYAPQPLVTRPGSVYLPLVPRTWFAPGRGPLMGRICPRGLPEVAWVLHESGYPLLVLNYSLRATCLLML